nr:MAG TPA: hypothetical protein [Caudoviricetes sp.]
MLFTDTEPLLILHHLLLFPPSEPVTKKELNPCNLSTHRRDYVVNSFSLCFVQSHQCEF